MIPDENEVYQNGGVGFQISRFHNPPHETYWVKGGVGVIQFRDEEFEDLLELLRAYDHHIHWRSFILGSVVGILIMTVLLVSGVFGG